MANNPVQIVLNTQNYIQRADPPGGFGGSKDFYAGFDQGFIKHKEKLLGNISSIRDQLANESHFLNYAHVVLSSEAWAKSHRPVKKIFPENKVQEVGGGSIGEMFVELTLRNIDVVEDAINKAEDDTTWEVDNKGNRKANPSRERSEVGGITEIRLHSPEDRRSFSIEQAVQWLSDPRSGGIYLVQMFITKKSVRNRIHALNTELILEEIADLTKKIRTLDLPLEITELEDKWSTIPLLVIKLKCDYSVASQSDDIEKHEKLLAFLESEPLVRKIMLPPIIDKTQALQHPTEEIVDLPNPSTDLNYPILGIIDTGINQKGPLNPWIEGSSGFLDPSVQDLSHGTFIGGLTSFGSTLNTCNHLDEAPCKIYDLGLFTDYPDAFQDYYPDGFVDFLEQLDIEINEVKHLGVRIFNMSLSVVRLVSDDSYSVFAAMIDEISDKHDVIIVLPAGNLDSKLKRNPWPAKFENVIEMLAKYRYLGQDRILQPADSIRSVVVGALNPPTDEAPDLIPAQYTRRGPGTALGTKPDLAHIGGRFEEDSGLFSIDSTGKIIQGCGTSYAAPLVAKTLANLNHIIEGDVPRETLIGILIHNAELLKALDNKSLKYIAKDFVGHGLPCNALDCLSTDEHSISLVFNGRLIGRHELMFQFAWPASLVAKDGKCKGKVTMTLVYKPFTIQSYDAEYIRVNMDAFLRQEKIDTKTGEISYRGFFQNDSDSTLEKERIEHGQKWWPIKKRQRLTKSGVGNSSQWRLVVSALTRAGDVIPEEGIPFSVIITIEDPTKTAPVFNEVRRTLQANGATISDIRTAASVRVR